MSVVTVTMENFQSEVMESEKPVLLDFWADWCAPCRAFAPIIDEVAVERPDVKVGKIDVSEQSALAVRFGVMGVPTLLVVKNGEITERSVGAATKEQILALLG